VERYRLGSSYRDRQESTEGEQGRGLELQRPKTARSAGTIALPTIALEVLRSYKAIQAERRMRLGKVYNDLGLVLAEPDGTFIRPDALSTNFAAFIRRHPELPKDGLFGPAGRMKNN
jgi:hypothetical protein